MSDINIYDTWKNIKKLYGNNNLQIQEQYGITNLN